MRIDLILLPWDSGRRGERMGRGPESLVQEGLAARLRSLRNEVETVTLDTSLEFGTEAAVAFDLARTLAGRVRDAQRNGRFPVVLAGNCMSALGTVTGLGGGATTGVVWLDAHADFNTPETSTSAFLDGMAAAVLAGRCWSAAAAAVGLQPVPERSMVLAGVRDIDAAEAELLVRSDIAVLSPAAVREPGRIGAALDALPAAARSLYLHVDLDVLDPDAVGPANGFASPGGLTLDEVLGIVREVAHRREIAAVNVCAYDPAVDSGGAVGEAASAIIAACARR